MQSEACSSPSSLFPRDGEKNLQKRLLLLPSYFQPPFNMSSEQQPVDVTDLDAAQVSLYMYHCCFRALCLTSFHTQLQDVGKQLEQELQHLTASYGQLKAAQAKFRTCIESVNAIKPENADKEILVPLTGSLYVPGTIADTQRVIVDIGTGYYVEKVSTSEEGPKDRELNSALWHR
jgi:prefoldin alpha subunit